MFEPLEPDEHEAQMRGSAAQEEFEDQHECTHAASYIYTPAVLMSPCPNYAASAHHDGRRICYVIQFFPLNSFTSSRANVQKKCKDYTFMLTGTT
jgi:hypothetical protein